MVLPVDAILVGDRLLVRPGEKVAMHGIARARASVLVTLNGMRLLSARPRPPCP